MWARTAQGHVPSQARNATATATCHRGWAGQGRVWRRCPRLLVLISEGALPSILDSRLICVSLYLCIFVVSFRFFYFRFCFLAASYLAISISLCSLPALRLTVFPPPPPHGLLPPGHLFGPLSPLAPIREPSFL